MWRQRIANHVYVKPVFRPVRPLLRTTQLLPRRGELRDLRAWRRDAALHRRVRRGGLTVLNSRHGRDLARLAADVERRGVPGDLVDCGVWNGGSTVLLASGAPSRDVWAFDSFEGLPEPSERDPDYADRWVGEFAGSEQRLRQGFRDHDLPNPLHVVKGWFEETLPAEAEGIDSIAVLHVDADFYEPVLLVLRALYPKLSPGGWVAVDDYEWWDGARLAVDEFRAESRIESPIMDQHYWRKPGGGTREADGARI